MRHTTSQSLYDYWNGLRGARKAPSRTEISPHDIKNLLSEVFILECADALTYRFRLAGTRICELFGREMRGRNLLDLWTRQERESIESLAFSVIEDHAAAVLGVRAVTENGDSEIIEILLLPLTSMDKGQTRILGCASFRQNPPWLGASPVTGLTIKSLRLLWPDHTPQFAVSSELAEPVFEPPFQDKMPARRTPQLRVIDGGLDGTKAS
jgi:hypothetical protein